MKARFIFIFCVFSASVSLAQTSLNLNLIQGKEYSQTSNAKMTMTQDVMGQTIEINAVITGKMIYLVKGISPAGYDMDIRYESMSMEMIMPQATIKFSSENPTEGDMMSQVLSGMINKPFTAQLSKTGKVISVKNIDALFTAAFEKFPNISESQKEQVKSQLNQSYGEKAFTSNLEMIFAIYPEKPVKLGEKWNVQTKLKSSISANISTTYSYAEEGSDFRRIRGESKITAEDSGEYTVSNGMEMKFDMNGTMVSDIKVDKKTGWILEANVKQDIKGNANIRPNEQMPEGMSIPMTIKTEMINTGN